MYSNSLPWRQRPTNPYLLPRARVRLALHIGQQNTTVGERGHTVSVYINKLHVLAPNEFTAQ